LKDKLFGVPNKIDRLGLKDQEIFETSSGQKKITNASEKKIKNSDRIETL
jgi:hypothetical protein